ncbi:MAG: hypothetical protein ACJ8AW_44730 [Rhodopila sp.]
MDGQPVKRGRSRPGTGTAQDGAARQAAYDRRKRDRATTLAIALVLLARKDDAIRRSLDRPTLEAMRDSLTPTGNSRKNVETWIASLTENQPSPPSGNSRRIALCTDRPNVA